MLQFSPHVSPAVNLKNHVSSAICEVIRLLENIMLSGNYDGNQLDYSLYKLDQVVYLCVCCQNIWPDSLADVVIQLLLTVTAYLKKILKLILVRLQAVRQFTPVRQVASSCYSKRNFETVLELWFFSEEDC